jgi:hypothetical protein
MTIERDADRPRLSDVQITEMMKLMKGSDSVELKVTVPLQAHGATIRGLGVDPVEAQPRQVFFFDTPDLQLNQEGVVVRARRIQGGRGDTVVKLRPVVPADLPGELRLNAAVKVEVDVIPGGFVASASFKGKTTGAAVRDAVAGDMPLRKLFSKDQRAFYEQHAPAGVAFESLVPLGPTFVLKGQITPRELGRVVVVEMWLYQDGSRILELSTKCLPGEAFQVAAEARSFLAGQGVVIGGIQQTKTKAALEFFSAQLLAAGNGDATESDGAEDA